MAPKAPKNGAEGVKTVQVLGYKNGGKWVFGDPKMKMMKNYGVGHYSKTEAFRNSISEKYIGDGNPAFGKSWYTNGENSVLCFEPEIPDGFYPGMHFAKSGEDSPFFGKTHSEQAKRKMSLSRKGKPSPFKGKPNLSRKGKWINDGSRNKFLKEGGQIPDGFVFGLLRRK